MSDAIPAGATRAVFLSYAREDAEAARRIAGALREFGVEVWFDENELRSGDAWDQKIRRQIKECTLFVPVISANTTARTEGYFRLEWHLAEQRTYLMAHDQAFLVPVLVDDSAEASARVPERFRERQWTRLPGGETPADFCQRVKKLLAGVPENPPATERGRASPAPASRPHRSRLPLLLGAPALLIVLPILILAFRPRRSPEEIAKLIAVAENLGAVAAAKNAPRPQPPPVSEARQLVAKAKAMSLDKYDSSSDDFATAEGLIRRALALDQNDAEIWTVSSMFSTSMRTRGFDHSTVRREMARSDAERALKLDPDSADALFALGRAQRDFDGRAAETTFRKILATRPSHPGALSELGWLADQNGRPDEAAAYYDRALAVDPAHGPLNRYEAFLLYFHYSRFAEADRAIRRSIALQPAANSQAGLAMLLLTWKGDAEGAAAELASGPAAARNEPRTIWISALVDLCRRKPEEVIRTTDRLADDFIQDNWFAGPKAYFTGLAHAMAGRPEAARLAWESALVLVEVRLKAAPENLQCRVARGQLLAWLGQTEQALREARAVAELLQGRGENYWYLSPATIYAALGSADEALPRLEKLCARPVGQYVAWPLTPALLRLDPRWDKIRGDPRFQKLAAGGVTSPRGP